MQKMTNRYRILFILLCFFCWEKNAYAQTPKYSNEFLTIGVSARAHGMSNSVVASVNDVYSGFWNPAGLTEIEMPFTVAGMHAEWFAGIAKYDYVGIAKKLNRNPEKESTFGFSLVRLAVDNIPNTFFLVSPDGSINYDNVTEFSAADYAFIISYAQKIPGTNISIGGGPKIIRRVIGTFGNAWGFGIDLGAQYKKGNWQFGVMARDISFTFNGWDFNLNQDEQDVFIRTGNEIPSSSLEITTPRLILGAAWKKYLNSKITLLTELNIDMTTDGKRPVLISGNQFSFDPHIGIEAGYDNLVFLRAGIGNIQKAKSDINFDDTVYTLQPNIGLGIKLGRFGIDYAFTDLGNVSQVLYSHIFSVKVEFPPKQTADEKNLLIDGN